MCSWLLPWQNPVSFLLAPPPTSFSFYFFLSGIRSCDYFFSISPFFFFNFCLFIFGWAGSACCVGFSLTAVGGLLIAVVLLLWSTGSRACRLQELLLWAQQLQLLASEGSVDPKHVAPSQIRDWICVSRIGRRVFFLPLSHQGSPVIWSFRLYNQCHLLSWMVLFWGF